MAKRPYRVPVAVPTKDEALVPTKADASFLEIASLLHRVAELHEHINSLGSHLAGHKAEIAQFIKLANASEQKRDARLAAVEKAGAPGFVQHFGDEFKAVWEAINRIHDSHHSLEAQVAGMQVSREVLTPVRERHDTPEMERRWRERMTMKTLPPSPHFKDAFPINGDLPQPTFTATAYVDGGHAATDEQPYPEQAAMEEMAEINQKAGLYDEPACDPRWNHGDLDPETAEAQQQPDDDQETAVNDDRAVEAWAEAKRGECA